MQIDTATLTPWADFNRVIRNARSLSVRIGKTEHVGDCEMTFDDETGRVTLAFPAKKGKGK